MPIHKVLLWSGFGIAVRLWQLGIEMRPLFHRSSLWVYPVYAGIGGSFGYWLMGAEQRQIQFLTERREALMEKRRRRSEREGAPIGGTEEADVHIGGTVDGGNTGVGLKPEERRPQATQQ